MTTLIGNKRQRSGSGEAESGMVFENEGDEGTSDSSSGDRQGGDRQDGMGMGVEGQDRDRQGGESDGNSRATSRQRLGGGGKAGVLT